MLCGHCSGVVIALARPGSATVDRAPTLAAGTQPRSRHAALDLQGVDDAPVGNAGGAGGSDHGPEFRSAVTACALGGRRRAGPLAHGVPVARASRPWRSRRPRFALKFGIDGFQLAAKLTQLRLDLGPSLLGGLRLPRETSLRLGEVCAEVHGQFPGRRPTAYGMIPWRVRWGQSATLWLSGYGVHCGLGVAAADRGALVHRAKNGAERSLEAGSRRELAFQGRCPWRKGRDAAAGTRSCDVRRRSRPGGRDASRTGRGAGRWPRCGHR